ncbi:MAG: transposase [Candidatus Latescibacterota bacterium]|jgi:transposase
MKVPNIGDFSLLVGIDWADQKHDICERCPDDGKLKLSVISSKPEAIEDWAISLRKRFPGKPVAVCCELTKGPLVYALLKYPHIVIFPVNPASIAKYRKSFTSSGAKDDPTDAAIQAEFLALHMDKLRKLEPESPSVRALAQFLETRRRIVQDKVDTSNRIMASLKNHFPLVLDIFQDRDTVIFCDFLERWPTLKEAKTARKSTLLTFFENHNARYPKINEDRVSAIKGAIALTDDCGVIDPNVALVRILIAQLRLLIGGIESLDKEIRTRYRAFEDRNIFNSFPGAGPQMAPRIFVAFGENRQRYQHPEELQKYSGIAPVLERSGKQEWVHWRRSCPKFLRQTFVEWAGLSIRYSFWAQAYYDQQKEKGKRHQTIIRALAFKWIRIAFRCWQTRTPYDEAKYLTALKKRNSPLLKFAVEN